jgi:hypothetical protein
MRRRKRWRHYKLQPTACINFSRLRLWTEAACQNLDEHWRASVVYRRVEKAGNLWPFSCG